MVRIDGGRRGLAAAMAAGLLAALGGCGFILPDHVHEQWRAAATAPRQQVAAPADGAMIGLALSGGGSRAAVFAAAVIEQLDVAGIAPRVTHVSSVSGGGFAASYFVARQPDCAAEAQACRAAYFDGFRQAMREDFFWAMEWNQIASPIRITSPTRRALSLQEALDDAFLGGVDFGGLPPSPVLLINTTRYDDGRRFVLSNLAIPDEPGGDALLSKDALRAASFSRPGCPRPTPADMPVSLAVATSAGFPPAIGPVTLEAPSGCDGGATQFWHLGDGGVIENSGVETLEELALRDAVSGGPIKRALIFAVDASKAAFDPATFQDDDVNLWTSNPGIVVDAAKARGEAYHDLTWERVLEEQGVEVEIIRIRYTDAAIADRPSSCDGDLSASAAAIAGRLADIPTDLAISDCDADLMEAAARELAPQALEANRALLARYGLGAGE